MFFALLIALASVEICAANKNPSASGDMEPSWLLQSRNRADMTKAVCQIPDFTSDQCFKHVWQCLQLKVPGVNNPKKMLKDSKKRFPFFSFGKLTFHLVKGYRDALKRVMISCGKHFCCANLACQKKVESQADIVLEKQVDLFMSYPARSFCNRMAKWKATKGQVGLVSALEKRSGRAADYEQMDQGQQANLSQEGSNLELDGSLGDKNCQ